MTVGKVKASKFFRKPALLKRPKVFRRKDTSRIVKELDSTLEKISEHIRTRAYYIWEEMGKPHGKDVEIWIKAEADIRSQLLNKEKPSRRRRR